LDNEHTHTTHTQHLHLLMQCHCFINVPPDLIIENIDRRWEIIQVNTAIPKDEFMLLNSYLIPLFFNLIIQFTNKYLAHQWAPLSPIVADMILQDPETKALEFSP